MLPVERVASAQRAVLVRIVGTGILLFGLFASWRAMGRMGIDDFPSLQLTARGAALGDAIYDYARQRAFFETEYRVGPPPGMFYPPSTGFMLLPFAFLPPRVGEFLWFSCLTAAVVLGVRALLRVLARERADRAWPVAAGLILLSAAMRWGMTPLQGAPLMFGMLCLLVAALQSGRSSLAFLIVAFATAFKVTLALPFLGLLALHRRFGMLAGAIGTWILLNVVGFARMGAGALQAYRTNMSTVEALGNINTPNPWEAISIPRTDWVYLLVGLGGKESAMRLVSLVLSAALAAWLLRERIRLNSLPEAMIAPLFLAPLVCWGSMAVYHHHYDLSLFFAPLLVAYFGPVSSRLPSWALWLAMPLVSLIALLPVAMVQGVVIRHFGVGALGWLNLAFPVTTSLALAGSLVVLHRASPNQPA